jgi:DNA-binding LacI/PurR family transcriptional regulator
MVIFLRVTIGVVAEKAGVSKTTVSRILNGNYAHTTEETRKRVLKVIEDLDYRPNALAKGLKSMKTNVIGIVLSNLKNPFWSTVLEGVERTCQSLGYNLMICNSNEEPEKEEQYIREFQTRQVDGIVINPTVRNLKLYQKLVDAKYPLVIINRSIPNLDTHHVVVDNVKGSFIAVDHLLKQGRKKVVVFVFRNPYVSTWKERLEGYQAAFLTNGLSKDDYRIHQLDQQNDSVKDSALHFFREYPDTDAVFSTSNIITLEVIEAIKELNLRIPEDIAFVSYDETVWTRHLNPPLTTIRQPGQQMGEIAAKILIKTIEEKDQQYHKTVVLQPELIVRKSSSIFQKI